MRRGDSLPFPVSQSKNVGRRDAAEDPRGHLHSPQQRSRHERLTASGQASQPRSLVRESRWCSLDPEGLGLRTIRDVSPVEPGKLAPFSLPRPPSRVTCARFLFFPSSIFLAFELTEFSCTSHARRNSPSGKRPLCLPREVIGSAKPTGRSESWPHR